MLLLEGCHCPCASCRVAGGGLWTGWVIVMGAPPASSLLQLGCSADWAWCPHVLLQVFPLQARAPSCGWHVALQPPGRGLQLLLFPTTYLKYSRKSLSVMPGVYLPISISSGRRMAAGTVASMSSSMLPKPVTLTMACSSAGVVLLCRGTKLQLQGRLGQCLVLVAVRMCGVGGSLAGGEGGLTCRWVPGRSGISGGRPAAGRAVPKGWQAVYGLRLLHVGQAEQGHPPKLLIDHTGTHLLACPPLRPSAACAMARHWPGASCCPPCLPDWTGWPASGDPPRVSKRPVPCCRWLLRGTKQINVYDVQANCKPVWYKQYWLCYSCDGNV